MTDDEDERWEEALMRGGPLDGETIEVERWPVEVWAWVGYSYESKGRPILEGRVRRKLGVYLHAAWPSSNEGIWSEWRQT